MERKILMKQLDVVTFQEESAHVLSPRWSVLFERRLRRSSAFLILLLLFQAEFGLAWDRNWHDYLGRNQFLIPPHIMSYTGMGGTGVVALLIVLIETLRYRQKKPGVDQNSTIRVLRFFYAPLGFVIIGFGTLIDLAAAPLDNFWHSLYGIDVTLWSPFHLMGMVGSILAGLGLLYALASEAAIERDAEYSSHCFLGLNIPEWGAIAFFAALIELAFIGLTAFKPLMLASFSVITYPLALALVSGFCLVGAVQFTRKPGTASLVILVLWILAFVMQLFVLWVLHVSSAFFHIPFRNSQEPVFNVMFVILPLLLLCEALLVDSIYYWQSRVNGAKSALQGAWKLGALISILAVFVPCWMTLTLLHMAPHILLPVDIFQAFVLDTSWPGLLLSMPMTLLIGAGGAALATALGNSWNCNKR
jgi:hypothetical protein